MSDKEKAWDIIKDKYNIYLNYYTIDDIPHNSVTIWGAKETNVETISLEEYRCLSRCLYEKDDITMNKIIERFSELGWEYEEYDNYILFNEYRKPDKPIPRSERRVARQLRFNKDDHSISVDPIATIEELELLTQFVKLYIKNMR